MKLVVRSHFSMTTACLLLLWICGSTAHAAMTAHPLAPPDTSSPRATLTTFLDEMNRAVQRYKADDHPAAKGHVERAMRCLNLAKEPESVRYVLGFYSALYLKETLDRMEIPPLGQIPDRKALEAEKSSVWTLPKTEITIAGVKDNSGIEGFLFTPDTVRNTELFYEKVRLLPYKPGCVGAMYEQFNESAGSIFPKRLIERFPGWLRKGIWGQAVWQWASLGVFLLVGIATVFLIHRHGTAVLGVLDSRTGRRFRSTVGGLILPVALILFAQSGLWFIVYGLHFLQAAVYVPVAMVFLSISYLGTIWLIGACLSRAASFVIAMGRFAADGTQATLIRLCFDVVTAVLVVATAVTLGARLGLPTYSLVAGLGVGGLAVALAGREALSNLIGTIMILLDQPFKVGDFIVVGDGDRGTVTEIGVRSTRIRTRDGILVSIPNSSVSNMRIVNESAPVSEVRIRLPVTAAYGSSLDGVEQAILSACKGCEYVACDQAPSVRLVRFGDSALEFQLLVWIVRPEFRGRATNQINRAICDEFRKRGIEIPFPQRDIRIRENEQA
ncbi:MAG: mechanosensitive ion channel family protein [Thermodesulfobacteriota bacterium]